MVTHYPNSSAATDSRAVNVSLKKDVTQCVTNAIRNPLLKEPEFSNDLSHEDAVKIANEVIERNRKLKLIDCAFCGDSFERRTTWQKYCKELCKIRAYEQRTGKKWHGKKTAGQGV